MCWKCDAICVTCGSLEAEDWEHLSATTFVAQSPWDCDEAALLGTPPCEGHVEEAPASSNADDRQQTAPRLAILRIGRPHEYSHSVPFPWSEKFWPFV